MRNRLSHITLVQILGAGAVTVALGFVGRRYALSTRKTKVRKSLDKKLDLALADSMDCSDSVARY